MTWKYSKCFTSVHYAINTNESSTEFLNQICSYKKQKLINIKRIEKNCTRNITIDEFNLLKLCANFMENLYIYFCNGTVLY